MYKFVCTSVLFLSTHLLASGCASQSAPSRTVLTKETAEQISPAGQPPATDNAEESQDTLREAAADVPTEQPEKQQPHTDTPLLDIPFVLSSFQSLQGTDGRFIFLFESPDGKVFFSSLLPNASSLSNPTAIAERAQIGCSEHISGDHFRIGIIERHIDNADYRLSVREYAADSGAQSYDTWNVTTRGFVPDASSKCYFLDHRRILTNGTRPHGDKAPYHGLFIAESRGLTQIHGASENMPELLYGVKQNGEIHLWTREVRRTDTTIWPQIIYKLNADNSLTEILSGDFILPDNTVISGSGCIDSQCIFKDDQIYSISSIKKDTYQLLTKNNIIYHAVYASDAGWKTHKLTDSAWILPISRKDNEQFICELDSIQKNICKRLILRTHQL